MFFRSPIVEKKSRTSDSPPPSPASDTKKQPIKKQSPKNSNEKISKINLKEEINSPPAVKTEESPPKKLSPELKAIKKEDKTATTIKSEDAKEKTPAAQKNVHSFFISKKDGGKDQSTIDAGAKYDPAKTKYHPVNDAFWVAGENVPYLALTKTFELIEEISGRLRMIEVLANFFRSVIALSPQDLVACVYLCQNQLAPAYVGLELGIAETSLMKIIAQTTGRSLAQIRTDAKNTGDLGLVAEQSKSNQRMMIVPAALQVRVVFGKLQEIAKMTGSAVSSMATFCKQILKK